MIVLLPRLAEGYGGWWRGVLADTNSLGPLAVAAHALIVERFGDLASVG